MCSGRFCLAFERAAHSRLSRRFCAPPHPHQELLSSLRLLSPCVFKCLSFRGTAGLQWDFQSRAAVQLQMVGNSAWNQCTVDELLLPPDPSFTPGSKPNLSPTSQRNPVGVPWSEPLSSRSSGEADGQGGKAVDWWRNHVVRNHTELVETQWTGEDVEEEDQLAVCTWVNFTVLRRWLKVSKYLVGEKYLFLNCKILTHQAGTTTFYSL